ncbi:hypothetical protein [Cellulomonas sp. HZM]|uniref:hypothetical protein n=1 Tax=Cellulomonas sp. HZM TaxID=1454010 RepID=UPI00049386F0|nr:hypothetical protein [Cellulomonas sp. HZM]
MTTVDLLRLLAFGSIGLLFVVHVLSLFGRRARRDGFLAAWYHWSPLQIWLAIVSACFLLLLWLTPGGMS